MQLGGFVEHGVYGDALRNSYQAIRLYVDHQIEIPEILLNNSVGGCKLTILIWIAKRTSRIGC